MKTTRSSLVKLEFSADEVARMLGVTGRLLYARVTIDNGLMIEVEVPESGAFEWLKDEGKGTCELDATCIRVAGHPGAHSHLWKVSP